MGDILNSVTCDPPPDSWRQCRQVEPPPVEDDPIVTFRLFRLQEPEAPFNNETQAPETKCAEACMSNYPAKQRITRPTASYGAIPRLEQGDCKSQDSYSRIISAGVPVLTSLPLSSKKQILQKLSIIRIS